MRHPLNFLFFAWHKPSLAILFLSGFLLLSSLAVILTISFDSPKTAHAQNQSRAVYLPVMARAFTGYTLPQEALLLYTTHDTQQGGVNFVLGTAPPFTDFPLTFAGGNTEPSNPTQIFSRDGRYMVYHRPPHNQLWIMSTDGRVARQLDESEEGRWIAGAQWGPDSETLLYKSGATMDYGTLTTINIHTGITAVAATDAESYEDGIWDSKYLRLYYVARDPVRIMAVNADGSNPSELLGGFTAPIPPSILTVVPDGRLLLRLHDLNGSDLYLLDPDGTDLTRLTNSAEYESGVAVSPDGTKLFFSHQATNTVFLMRMSGIVMWQYTFACDYQMSCMRGGSQTWSPTGDEVAFSWTTETLTEGTRHFLYVVKTNGDPTTPILINEGTQRLGSSAYSPDGTYLTFVAADSEKPTIMVLDRTTHTPEVLVEMESAPAVWTWQSAR